MRMSRLDWSDSVVKNLVDRRCSVVVYERRRNDDSRTLHVLELLPCQCSARAKFPMFSKQRLYV